jgi:hypothetical protein
MQKKVHDYSDQTKEMLVNKIITAITPIVYGLNHEQIRTLLTDLTQRVLETTVFLPDQERKALRTTY